MKSISIPFSAGVLLYVGSCATKPAPLPPIVAPVLNIYQPSVLILRAGAVVETTNGIYTAQTDEVWHSDKRYRELERGKF